MTSNRETLFTHAREAAWLVDELADRDAQSQMTGGDAHRREIVLVQFIVEARKVLRTDR